MGRKELQEVFDIAFKNQNLNKQRKEKLDGCFNCKHHNNITKKVIVKNRKKAFEGYSGTNFIECNSEKRAEYLKRDSPIIQKSDYKCKFFNL